MPSMDTSDIGSLLCCSSVSVEEEILVRNLLISHDPDGHDFHPELVLRAVKNVLHIATTSETKVTLETSFL